MDNNPLHTLSGKFYVNMTWNTNTSDTNSKDYIDFKRIDTDGDGCLSDSEICAERDRECKIGRRHAKTNEWIGIFTNGLLGLAITIDGNMSDSYYTDEQKKTDKYREDHNLSAKNTQNVNTQKNKQNSIFNEESTIDNTD